MDLLQISLVFLIILLAVFLSLLGIQVFFILKDLKGSLDKLDRFLNSLEHTETPGFTPEKTTPPSPVIEPKIQVSKEGQSKKRFYKRILK